LFLYIKMPEFTGLEILNSLLHPLKVILTTAYSEYALESYNSGVVDYLLKPISIERFLKVINKVTASTLIPAKKANNTEELQIKQDRLHLTIPFTSILYVQSFGNYLKIFTDFRMYLISETLTHITTILSENFQRTHKSYIANLSRVTAATRTHLLIENNKVPVSATYRVLVFKKMETIQKHI
ncbi:MAG: LytTR family DNA-binding domain-containing protein, partial [Bacteroidota bacterium]